MKLASLLTLVLAGIGYADFDLDAIRDVSTLETTVLQDWKPSPKNPAVRQKLVEITVCEWWSGQKVRLPVTLNAPANGAVCRNVIVANQPLVKRAFMPTGGQLTLLKEKGVGVVLIGMGTIDAMEPAGKLHNGMRQQLLATKDARYSPAWIWGMSQMRALTAALTEPDVFQPKKVLTTGGSKRGVAAAVAGIVDDRFTAILPVVAPIIGNPGAASYVIGSEPVELMKIDERFYADFAAGKLDLPATTGEALRARAQRRADNRVTLEQAQAANWSDSDIAGMTDRVWAACRIADSLDQAKERGLEFFYNVGTNDSVSPGLLELGEKIPDFPICIIPGGQHGGPSTAGFTRQVPKLPEIQDNFLSFARHHFFGERGFLAAPKIASEWSADDHKLKVTVTFADGVEPQTNDLWWSIDRNVPYTLPFEYDPWKSTGLRKTAPSRFEGTITLADAPKRVDFLSLHTHTENGLPLTVSSAATAGRFHCRESCHTPPPDAVGARPKQERGWDQREPTR